MVVLNMILCACPVQSRLSWLCLKAPYVNRLPIVAYAVSLIDRNRLSRNDVQRFVKNQDNYFSLAVVDLCFWSCNDENQEFVGNKSFSDGETFDFLRDFESQSRQRIN